MKKTNLIVISVIFMIIIFSIFMMNIINNKTSESQRISNQNYYFDDVTIFETTYEQLIDIMGNPSSITNIQDKDLIVNSGYFAILSYEGIDFTINSADNFELTGGEVVEIDIMSSTTKIMGTDINATKDIIKEKYSITSFHSLENIEEPISHFVLKGLKRNSSMGVKLDEYDYYCYLKDEESPIAIIFLFNDGLVKRILIRHLTAG